MFVIVAYKIGDAGEFCDGDVAVFGPFNTGAAGRASSEQLDPDKWEASVYSLLDTETFNQALVL